MYISPILVQLSNNLIDENSDADTVVGDLTTFDPDQGQSHTYQLITSGSDNKFKIKGNKLLVSDVLFFFLTTEVCEKNKTLLVSFSLFYIPSDLTLIFVDSFRWLS